jgi:hypothetical protein
MTGFEPDGFAEHRRTLLQIFKLFYTTCKEDGTGFGLWSAQYAMRN